MSVRYRRRAKPWSTPERYTADAGDFRDTNIEIETVVERLCACPCGRRWWAEAGSTTRCDGGVARFRCPVGDEPFEVPA